MRRRFSLSDPSNTFQFLLKGLSASIALMLALFIFFLQSFAQASCGANIQWSGGTNTQWNRNANWNGTNFPDNSGESALIVGTSKVPNSDTTVTISCFEIQSGTMNTTSGITMTVQGDYFRNLTANSLSVTAGSTWTVVMGGSTSQTLENQDTLNYVTISNPSTVSFTQPFQIRNSLSLTGSGTTLNINANLNLANTGAPFTIPATTTVVVASGATLTASGGITVNGTLRIEGGGSVVLGNGTTLSVGSGGLLQLSGTSGNVANIDSAGTFTFTVAGNLNSSYARISRVNASGVNVTGTLSAFDNTEIHYIASGGTAVTIGAAASIPGSMTGIGFYNDAGYATVYNMTVNASYAGGGTTVDNWSGYGGATYEVDPNSKVAWGAQSGTTITLGNSTAAGSPASSINQATGPVYFATFALALSKADVSTDLTALTLTIDGTATSGDVDYIQVFKDMNGNCTYEAATDTTQLGGGNLTVSGSPAKTSFTLSAGQVTLSSSTPVCLHVLLRTTLSATGGHTVGIKIASTADATFSPSLYTFSGTSGPPVSAGTSTIVGSALSIWDGSSNTDWTRSNNWANNTTPTSTIDCNVGTGTNTATLTANAACQNMTLLSGGAINFNNTTFELAVYGSLTVQSGFTFQNAASGTLAFRGGGGESMTLTSSTPGNLIIANTGGATVTVDGAATINGNIQVQSGIFKVSSGVNLTVLGNITVSSGATLDISPNATLTMGNGSTITINSGGILKMVGTAAYPSTLTSNATTSAYSVVVNGTIQAQYYNISRLGGNGLTINSGATIDTTYNLSNGTFSYPVGNNSYFLRLFRKVPSDTMLNMTFDANGSTATGVKSIYTDPSVAAGTLTLTNYSGTLTGATYSTGTSYLVSWGAPTNTLDLTQELTGPASVNGGSTYTMGMFGFKQSLAGATYTDTNITSLKLTLTGTGSSSDILEVRAYYSPTCTTSGGTLMGGGTFSGSPATITMSNITGAVVPASATSPSKVCVYVVMDIAGIASGGKTVGISINAATDEVNSNNYALSGSTPAPVTLGSPATIISTVTYWTGGAGTTAWTTAGNWNSGVPNSTMSCVIQSASFLPTISSGTATCKSVLINSGTLTLSAGATLEAYGDFKNSGTFTQSGTLSFRDGGASNLTQTITSGAALGTVTVNRTGSGSVVLGSTSMTIGTLNLTAMNGTNVTFWVQNGKTLKLTNGLSQSTGVFRVDGGGVLAIPNGKSISVTGGQFQLSGTADSYPQNTTNKAKVTVSGSGKWSFVANGGDIRMYGFIIDYIDENGLQFNGSTIITNFNGGQFTNLSNTYASIKAIQFNNSGYIPPTVSDIGWNWGPNNTPPSPSTTYYLATSTGCGNRTVNFDQWFGDFFVYLGNPDTTTKVSSTACTINIGASASPVSMLSMSATPYDSSVDLNWKTGSELDHAGFNIYRSTQADSGFVQINPSLIRNTVSSSSQNGQYRYLDSDVVNDQLYYYQIEDVATNGTRTMHGPMAAKPLAGLGAAPATPAGVNDGGSTTPGGSVGTNPTQGPVSNPYILDLGQGVHVLARTRTSLRLEVVVPTVSITDSTWNATYKKLEVPGYSNTIAAGAPELVERVVLVEVDGAPASASVSGVQTDEAALRTGVDVVPAPSWSLNSNGQLVPSWSLDSTAYALNDYSPSSFYDVASDIKEISGKHYVQIKISPFLYKAASKELRQASKLVFDIGLSGSAWLGSNTPPPSNLAAAAVDGALRIRFNQTGIYELGFDQMAAAGVEGPFAGADPAQLRLYFHDQEIPMQVIASSSAFGSGDKIRFYGYYAKTLEDSEDEVVLSRQSLMGVTTPPLRIAELDADPTAYSSSPETLTWRYSKFEQDLYPVFSEPVGDGLDKIYWGRILAQQGAAPTSAAYLSMPAYLPGLDATSSDRVRLRLYVKGGHSDASNLTHSVGLWINNMSFMAATGEFDSNDPTVLNFQIPASYFVNGPNNIQVQVLADQYTGGYWDMVYVDRMEVDYRADRVADNGVAALTNYYPNTALTVSGFTDANSVSVYDVTDRDNWGVLKNLSVNPSSQSVTFAARDFGSDYLGRKYLAYESANFLQPTAIFLGRGVERVLKDASNGADLIVIGSSDLLKAASELIRTRQSQGLRVVQAPLDQVYAEFGYGLQSTRAVRDFLQYAKSYWVAPAPKYVLILGDATYDSANRLGYGFNPPIPLEKGSFVDFGNDNWFVASETSPFPSMAIGRIPTSDPYSLSQYIEKLLAYENGQRSPQETTAKSLVFVSDKETFGEGFSKLTDNLVKTTQSSNANLVTEKVLRTDSTTDAQIQSEILSRFNEAPLVMTYVGHGAEDRWADGGVFTNVEASQLSNSRLPIVVGLNCSNAMFYDADPSFQSLAETTILNPKGGAVAFWASTTQTAPSTQVGLANEFFNQLALETKQTYHTVRLGDLTLKAKLAMSSDPAGLDTLKSYTLLGDPSMPLPSAAFKPEPPATQDSGGSHGGGCGLVAPPSTGGGAWPGAIVMMLLMPLLFLIRFRWAQARI